VEKLATPDVTIADLIGDIDPSSRARRHELGSEMTVHYGLLPRANRGIFAINELPTLPEKFRSACSTSCRKAMCRLRAIPSAAAGRRAGISANPEITQLAAKSLRIKDRIGSEIRTHYPASVEEGIAITTQEAWTKRDGYKLHIPKYVQEVIERLPLPPARTKKSTSAPA